MLLDDLVPHPDNPKTHDAAGIGSSMGRFGLIDQIAIDERTGYMISGHGRAETLLAVRAAGTAPPEGVVVDDAGGWTIPVNRGWRSGDDAEAKGALVALNKWVEAGGWNQETLADVLESLSSTSAGFEGIGFDADDANLLLALSGRTGEREGAFLDGVLADLGGEDGTTKSPEDRKLEGDAVTLLLTFADTSERDDVVGWLKARAGEFGVATMGEALLAAARDK